MFNLINKNTGKTVALDLQRCDWEARRFEQSNSFLQIVESEDVEGDYTHKIIIVDNFDRETVSDELFAAKSSLNTDEEKELDRVLNSDYAANYYRQVPIDHKLYTYEPDWA